MLLENQQETWDLAVLSKGHGSGGNELATLTRNLVRLGKCLHIPISSVPVPYFGKGVVQHPVISVREMITFMIVNGFSKFFLGGYDVQDERSKTVLKQFWLRYQCVHPEHVALSDPTKQLENLVPLTIYGDEGTGRRRHPVYILATKAVLNCRASSYHRNFLYTVLPHECYRGYNKGSDKTNECIDAISETYALEAQGLYETGRCV